MPKASKSADEPKKKGRGHEGSSPSVLRSSSGGGSDAKSKSKQSGSSKEVELRKKLEGLKKREDVTPRQRKVKGRQDSSGLDSDDESEQVKVPDRRKSMFAPSGGSGLSAFGAPSVATNSPLNAGTPSGPSGPVSPFGGASSQFSFTSAATSMQQSPAFPSSTPVFPSSSLSSSSTPAMPAPTPAFSFTQSAILTPTPTTPTPTTPTPKTPTPTTGFSFIKMPSPLSSMTSSSSSVPPSPAPAAPSSFVTRPPAAASTTKFVRPPPLKPSRPLDDPQAANTIVPINPADLANCRLPGVLEDAEANPLTPRRKNALQGMLDAMISTTEMRERDVTPFERSNNGSWDMAKAIASYSRSTPGKKIDPQMVRTPRALNKSFTYLVDQVVDAYLWKNDVDFPHVYHFTRDRLRAISQEFNVQSIVSEARIKVMEMSARFFILSDHLLCEVDDNAVFSSQQNNERMSDCLTTLKALYRECPGQLATQPEFACYSVLHQLGQALDRKEAMDFQAFLQQLPSWVLDTPEINFALEVYNACFQGLYAKFFRLMRRASYLQACMMHMVSSTVRIHGLKTLYKACAKKRPIMEMGDFVELFGFDDANDALYFLSHFPGALQVSDGKLERGDRPLKIPASKGLRRVSRRVIESKRKVGYSSAFPFLLNRHIMQGIDLQPLKDRAVLLAKDAERQQRILRSDGKDTKVVYSKDTWVTGEKKAPQVAVDTTPAPTQPPVNPFKLPPEKSPAPAAPERRVRFGDEVQINAPSAPAPVNPFAAPSAFSAAAGSPAKPSALFPSTTSAQTGPSTGGFSFTAITTPAAPPPKPSPTFSFTAAMTPATTTQPPAPVQAGAMAQKAAPEPPKVSPPQPFAPLMPTPPPPMPTPTPPPAASFFPPSPPVLPSTTPAQPKLTLPPEPPSPDNRLPSPERTSQPQPPAVPSPAVPIVTQVAEIDTPSQPPPLPPPPPPPLEIPAEQERPSTPPPPLEEVIIGEEQRPAQEEEEEEEVPVPRRQEGDVGRHGVRAHALSERERDVVMAVALDSSSRRRCYGDAGERMTLLVGPEQECPVTSFICHKWPTYRRRDPLDLVALLTPDVGHLETLPIVLSGRRDMRLCWEIVVLSEQPIEDSPETVRDPRLAQWVVGQLLTPDSRDAACSQEPTELESSLKTIAMYEVTSDPTLKSGNPFEQGEVVINVSVRHGNFSNVFQFPGFSLLVYVCDHELPPDDFEAQLDCLLDRLPMSVIYTQEMDVPPALLMVHDERLLLSVRNALVHYWDMYIGGEVLFLDASTTITEGYAYDATTATFRCKPAKSDGESSAMELEVHTEPPSDALAFGLQALFRHAAEWLSRLHTAYRCELGPLLERCLDHCLGGQQTLDKSQISRDLRRLLLRPIQSTCVLVEVCHLVVNAVLSAIGDVVAELPFLMCTMAAAEKTEGIKPVGTNRLHSWMSGLRLPPPNFTQSHRPATHEVEAVWQHLSDYTAVCMRAIVNQMEALEGHADGLLGKLEWRQPAMLTDGKIAAALDMYVQAAKTIVLSKGDATGLAMESCFAVVQVLAGAMINMVEHCGVVLYSCSPPEEISAVVRGRCAIKEPPPRKGTRTALDPFLETARRLQHALAAKLATTKVTSTPTLPSTPSQPAKRRREAITVIEVEPAVSKQPQVATVIKREPPDSPTTRRRRITRASLKVEDVPMPTEKLLSDFLESETGTQLLDDINTSHTELQKALQQCRQATASEVALGSRVDQLCEAIEDELRIWEEPDMELPSLETEVAADDDEMASEVKKLDDLLNQVRTQRVNFGRALLSVSAAHGVNGDWDVLQQQNGGYP